MMFIAKMILAIRWYFLCTVYLKPPFVGGQDTIAASSREQCVFLTEKHFGAFGDAPKITE